MIYVFTPHRCDIRHDRFGGEKQCDLCEGAWSTPTHIISAPNYATAVDHLTYGAPASLFDVQVLDPSTFSGIVHTDYPS